MPVPLFCTETGAAFLRPFWQPCACVFVGGVGAQARVHSRTPVCHAQARVHSRTPVCHGVRCR